MLRKAMMDEDQATGIHQKGKSYGVIYHAGIELKNSAEVNQHLDMGMAIHVPNAGAGSYREIFTDLGVTDIEPIDQTASDGSWTFSAIRDGSRTLIHQENRYPNYGFRYVIDPYHE